MVPQLLKSSEDDEFIVAESSGKITFFHRESPRAVFTISSARSPLQDVDWSATNAEKVSAFVDGHCLIWNVSASTLPKISHEVSSEASGLVRYGDGFSKVSVNVPRWSRVSDRILAVSTLNNTTVSRLQDSGHFAALASVDGHASAISWHAVSSSCIVAMGSVLVLILSGM